MLSGKDYECGGGVNYCLEKYVCLEKTLSLKNNFAFLDKINTVSVYVMQLFSTAILYPNTKKK